MPPRLRKVVLVTHVTCSVGWMIGVVAGFLALAGPLAVVDATVRAACVAMDLITGAVVVPLAPASLLSRHGTALSRDALERRLAKHAATAARAEPTLTEKKISPHVLRHTAAMRLLAAGVDSTVIALWLGHESVTATQIYIHADFALKEQSLARTVPLGATPGRYRPSDTVMAFLDGL